LIKNIGKQKTVIYCSHILSEVSATCSRILIINNGSSVATGTPDELTAHMGTGNFYTLKIKGDKNAIQSRLSGVHDVINVTVAPGPGDWQLARISSEGTEDIGEAIFRCVVDAGFSLAELKRESASLEEVFTKLTKGLSA
jgi:ABC-2 type transport system ATP-binding protein